LAEDQRVLYPRPHPGFFVLPGVYVYNTQVLWMSTRNANTHKVLWLLGI